MFKFLTSRLAAPIATGVATLFFIGFVYQTIRVDGVPLFYTGMRTQLAECQVVNRQANEAAQLAIKLAREEGRMSADKDTVRIVAEEAERRKDTDRTIVELTTLVGKLRPQAIVVPGQPELPVVVTPPALPAVCRLDQGALDSIVATINSKGRGQ